MSDSNDIHVPSLDELRAAVIKRPSPEFNPAAPSRAVATESINVSKSVTTLSREAHAFLSHAVQPHHQSLGLEERWKALGITSGSVKNRTLDVLRGRGFIHIERKGRNARVHVYNSGYEFLGIETPRGEGTGGTTHREIVQKLSEKFAARGYEVHIEYPIGVPPKRVDAVLFGRDRKIGIEVGLTSVEQEIKNLQDDLKTGVLDRVLFVTTDPKILEKVKKRASEDDYLQKHWTKLRFYLYEGE